MSMTLPLIAKLGTLIQWDKLDNKWYREDFTHDCKCLMDSVRKIEVVLICASRIAYDIREKTRDLLEDIIPPAKKYERDLRLQLIQNQPTEGKI